MQRVDVFVVSFLLGIAAGEVLWRLRRSLRARSAKHKHPTSTYYFLNDPTETKGPVSSMIENADIGKVSSAGIMQNIMVDEAQKEKECR